MIRRMLLASLFAVTLAGCAEKPEEPALREGDRVRPRLAFNPQGPWPAGGKVFMIMQLEVHRPGREVSPLLGERDVPYEGFVMGAKVTFFADGSPLGEPLDLPLMREC